MESVNLMNKPECWVDVFESGYVCILDSDVEIARISHEDAIAAARAILKHFNATLESDQ